MRILQLIGTLNRGGVEQNVLNLVKNGLETDICVEIPNIGELEEEFRSCGCKIYHLTKRSDSVKAHHKELADIVKDYDLIHINAQNAFLTYLEVRVIKKLGKKVIVHSHNTKDWRSTGLGVIMHLMFRPLLKHSCVKVACSTEAARWMFGTAKDVTLLPLPINTHKFAYKEPDSRSEKITLFHVGNFRKAKNHEFLIQLMKKLEKKYPGKYELYLAGDGELRKEMEDKAKGLPIHFLGSIENVNEMMSKSDIFLLPSLNEGLPTVSLEAQTNGLPCILSDLITRECEVTDLVRFLPLNVNVWVEEIEKTIFTENRESYEKIVEDTNGIDTTIEKFIKLYAKI